MNRKNTTQINFGVSASPARAAQKQWPMLQRNPMVELGILWAFAGVLLLTFVFRTLNLDIIPPGMHFDEVFGLMIHKEMDRTMHDDLSWAAAFHRQFNLS